MMNSRAFSFWFVASGLGAVDAAGRGSVDLKSNLDVDQQSKTRMLETMDFVPLGCNANLASASCATWTDTFGTSNVKTERITIPCGECIEMNFAGELTLLGGLDIHGKLTFPDDYKLNLTTTLITVQGNLDMKASKPVDGEPSIRFVMIGEDNQWFSPIEENADVCNNGQACNAGKKGIIVAGGKVGIDGLPANTPTWLNLYDVTDDLRGIIIDDSIKDKWAVGAEILVTSSTRKWDDHTARRILDVVPVEIETENQQGYVKLVLDKPIESRQRPTTLVESNDFAVEVALLSRNIVFQGGDDANSSHGGHLWVLNTPAIVQSIQGVEIVNFGQQGNLGRYPIHFHFCGDASGSVVSKNTIRQSNQRCVVVHGTDNLRIEENIAFDTKGHCYILEDGIETGNHFYRNLGAKTSIPEMLIPDKGSNGKETDDNPSTFWITNPSNTWVGNVAAGSERSGYWFEPLLRGDKANLYSHLDPKRDSLTLFKDNVAHSNFDKGVRTYPSGYVPDEEAHLIGLRSYRNSNGLFIHLTSNLVVDGGLYADNKFGIDIDRAEDIRVDGATIIGKSESYRNLMSTLRLDKFVCNAPHIGIELHTWKQDPDNKGVVIKNTEMNGFTSIPCNDAVPFSMDDTIRTGMFDLFTSVTNITVEDDLDGVADFCTAEAVGITDIYLTDLDGSLLPTGQAPTPGTSTMISDNPNMLNFVDPSKCIPQQGCYSYCTDTCFRSVRYSVNPASTEEYKLKVCKSFESGNDCVYFSGHQRGDDPTDAMRPRVFIAHLPAGSYVAVFVNANGDEVWPSFVDIKYEDVQCPEAFPEGAIRLKIPAVREATNDKPDGCYSLVKNGNFERSDTEPTFWLQRDGGIELVQGAGVGGSNAATGIDMDDRTTILQYIDNRCMKQEKGKFYEIKGRIKLSRRDGSPYHCYNPNNIRSCPTVGLYTEATAFRPVASLTDITNNAGFQIVQGFVQIDDDMASADEVALFVRSNVNNVLMTVDTISLKRVENQNSACENVIQYSSFEDSRWTGLWQSNRIRDNVKGELSAKSPGYNSMTALVYSNRQKIADGPMYSQFGLIEKHCLAPASSWKVTAQVMMIDRDTGLGAECDPGRRNSCPAVRLQVRDDANTRIFSGKSSEYSNWNANDFNLFETIFTLPPVSDNWDGSVGRASLEIRDFPVEYDIVVDDVKMQLLN